MSRSTLREKADRASIFKSRTLACVIENPKLLVNVTGIIRTAEALGVGQVYIIDDGKLKIPRDWQDMRDNAQLINLSASGIKWVYVKMATSQIKF